MIKELPVSNDVSIDILNRVFNNVTNSYKFLFLRSVTKIISDLGDRKILYKDIIVDFLYDLYYSVNYFHLNLGKQDLIYYSLKEIKSTFKFRDDVSESVFKQKLANEKKILKKYTNKFKRYVVQRLIEPFLHQYISKYKNKDDWKKDKVMKELSKQSYDCLYEIHEDCILIKENWFKYLFKNSQIIKGWINYHLINFLQDRNSNLIAISRKIYPPKRIRKLNSIRALFMKFIKEVNVQDVYTCRSFDNASFEKLGVLSIDHFVPFSYLMNDKVWNLLPTFKNINSKKSNKIISDEQCFESFLNLQFDFYRWLFKNKQTKLLEDYLDIFPKIIFADEMKKEDFIGGIKSTINPLLQNAVNQSYQQININNLAN